MRPIDVLKNWKKYLPIIGILLFAYILVKLDITKVVKEMKGINFLILLIAIFFVFIQLFIQTFKWYLIARFQDIKIPFTESFKINFISNFYGFVTPSKIGTIVRAEYLKKYTGNVGKGLSNFALDKIFDILSIIFLAILFSFVFSSKLDIPIVLFMFVLLGFVFLMLFFINRKRSRIVLLIFYKKFIPEKMKESAKITFESFYDHFPKRRYFILFFILNIINWIVNYASVYFIGLSLGIEISFIYYLAILPVVNLVAMIPITINGLGTQEATLIGLFSLFGVESSKVFSMSIISLVISILSSFIAIFFIWKKE